MKSMREFLLTLLHPGPIVTMLLIKTITLGVTYCSLMWWPPERSFGGLLCLTVFLCLSGLVMFHFFSAIYTGPGYVAAGWEPNNSEAKNKLQYCLHCKGYKAPRSHHCRKCGHCVMKLDHHCVWINGCVGHVNHAHFVAFLVSAVLGCAQASIILMCAIYRAVYRPFYEFHFQAYMETPVVYLGIFGLIWCLFALGCSIGVTLGVGFLLYYQLKTILTNRTMIEEWIEEKALYRRTYRTELLEFIYPYDLGWWKNFRFVMNNLSCKAVGDGIHWPVVEGCDQYTLTLEQLEQKKEKRARSKDYVVIENFSGSWFPISQGIMVVCHPPCSEEPRIKLIKDEKITVTRWKKYWLYGTQVVSTVNSIQGDRTLVKKGWFPRRCAVELIESNDTSESRAEPKDKQKTSKKDE